MLRDWEIVDIQEYNCVARYTSFTKRETHKQLQDREPKKKNLIKIYRRNNRGRCRETSYWGKLWKSDGLDIASYDTYSRNSCCVSHKAKDFWAEPCLDIRSCPSRPCPKVSFAQL